MNKFFIKRINYKNLSKLFFVIIFSLLPYQILFAAEKSAHRIDYIIDTDIGGDIDDVIALLLAINSTNKPLAVTTTHIEPIEKAKIAKLILDENNHSEIPVYAGIGSSRKDTNEEFVKLNSLWPPFYGYPHPSSNHKTWYETQAAAYKKVYGSEFENINIEKESAPEFIVKIAKQYSPQHPLIVISLAPMHNIEAALKIDSSIKNNIIVYSMGGTYPKGYNWLISPETTARVLAQVRVITISSEFIESGKLNITPDEFNKIENNIHTRLGKSVIADWKNWHKIDAVNKKITQLGDPVTLYLALHPEKITTLTGENITFPCLDDKGSLKPEFIGKWYSMPGMDNKIITTTNDNKSHVQFVKNIHSPALIKDEIMAVMMRY